MFESYERDVCFYLNFDYNSHFYLFIERWIADQNGLVKTLKYTGEVEPIGFFR